MSKKGLLIRLQICIVVYVNGRLKLLKCKANLSQNGLSYIGLTVQHVGVVELHQFALFSDFLNSVLASIFEIKRVLSYTESISRLDPEKVEILIIVKVTLQILREIKEKM